MQVTKSMVVSGVTVTTKMF